MSATESLTYEEACESHRWQVPERYNIAADVCDKQPGRQAGDGLRGLPRQPARGDLGRAALARQPRRQLLAAHGVERGDRVAVCAPASPETAAMFLGTWKLGRDPALAVGPLRRRGHPPPDQGLASRS